MIALLTDFGMSDPYVGSMKGVISAIAPGTPIVDLSHEVLPQNITQGGYFLWSCYKYFPAGTIFVCIVDPGVGTGRRVLCVEGAGYRFLGPDNGLMQLVVDSLARSSIFTVENRRYFRKEISPTFHGRDIFAPVAAHLSRGVPAASLGSRTKSFAPGERLVQISERRKRLYQGSILHIDRFGNLISNFQAKGRLPSNLLLHLGRRAIHQTFRTYGEAREKTPFLVAGSSGLIEISIRNGNAARSLHARIGQAITLKT